MSESAAHSKPSPRRFWRIHLSSALGLMLIFATLLVLNVQFGLSKVSLPFQMFADSPPGAVWEGGEEWMAINGPGWPFTIQPDVMDWWNAPRAQRIAALDGACGLTILLLSTFCAEWWLRQPRVRLIKIACLATLTGIALISGVVFTHAEQIPLSYFPTPPDVKPHSMLNNGSTFSRIGDPRLLVKAVALDITIVTLILLCAILLSEAATRNRMNKSAA